MLVGEPISYTKININHLPAGLYTYQCLLASGKQALGKIIKE
jgi:hypothetical protein